MNHLISRINIKSYFKKNILIFISAFIFGVGISSISFIYKLIENFRHERLIESEREININKKEKNCVGKNSNYRKFLNLGFPNTAIEKFNNCMKD